MILSRKFRYNLALFALSALVLPGISIAAQAENLSEVQRIEEISVIASRIEMPLRQVGASVSVLTAEDLKKKNFPSMADALRTLPSISVTQSGGLGKATGLRIRGEEAHRTLLLIDGINVSDLSAVQAMPRWAHLLNSQFDRVEVLRGPQGMMYGADAGGVISISSKQSQQPVEGDLSAEAGQFDTRKLSGNVRGTVNRLDYSLTTSTLSSDGFNAQIDDTTGDSDGYDNTTLHATGGWKISDQMRVGLVWRDTQGDSQFDGCGFPTSYGCEDNFEQQSGKLHWQYGSTTQNHELAYLQTTTNNINTVVEQGYRTLDNRGRLTQWQYVGDVTLAKDVSLVFGADHRKDSYRDNLNDTHFERDQMGAFVEGQVNFEETFFYTAGMRYDDNEDFGEHVSYRMTGAYLVPVGSNKVKFKGSYGTGLRAPSLYEIGYNNGEYAADYVPRELREEVSKGYELGAQWIFSDENFVELVWFLSRIENEIFFDLVAFGGYLQAEGETESRGVELSGSFTVTDRLVLGGNYTYNDTALSDNTTLIGAEPGGQRPRRPEHKYNLSIAYSLWQDRVGLTLFYRNSRDAVDYVFGAGRVALDNYAVLDLSASWQVSDALETFLRWENMLDEDYQEVPGYNTAGSAGYAGIRLHF